MPPTDYGAAVDEDDLPRVALPESLREELHAQPVRRLEDVAAYAAALAAAKRRARNSYFRELHFRPPQDVGDQPVETI